MTMNQQLSAVADDLRAIFPPCQDQERSPTNILCYFPLSPGKEKTDMECDLCKREPSVSGSLLCATCAEAIQRLVAIERDASVAGEASSDGLPSGARKTTGGAGHRDS